MNYQTDLTVKIDVQDAIEQLDIYERENLVLELAQEYLTLVTL